MRLSRADGKERQDIFTWAKRVQGEKHVSVFLLQKKSQTREEKGKQEVSEREIENR